jgi:hypothetical protein
MSIEFGKRNTFFACYISVVHQIIIFSEQRKLPLHDMMDNQQSEECESSSSPMPCSSKNCKILILNLITHRL